MDGSRYCDRSRENGRRFGVKRHIGYGWGARASRPLRLEKRKRLFSLRNTSESYVCKAFEQTRPGNCEPFRKPALRAAAASVCAPADAVRPDIRAFRRKQPIRQLTRVSEAPSAGLCNPAAPARNASRKSSSCPDAGRTPRSRPGRAPYCSSRARAAARPESAGRGP